MIRATVLNDGEAQGPVLVLEAPLSFWGGFDPRTGMIIDVHHPQRGAFLAGAILLMREARGSGSSPGAIAEAIRLGTAPAAIVLVTPDVNLAIGAQVAGTLYGQQCPVLAASADDYELLQQAAKLRISRGGAISAEPV
jgi:predicted aconitase with swiveling domain